MRASRPATYFAMKGSSFAGISWDTSAHSSSGIREGQTISRTRDILFVVGLNPVRHFNLLLRKTASTTPVVRARTSFENYVFCDRNVPA